MRVCCRELLVRTQNSNSSDDSLTVYVMGSMLNALDTSSAFSHNKPLRCGYYYNFTDWAMRQRKEASSEVHIAGKDANFKYL